MSKLNGWQSGTALFLALSMTAGAAAPIVMQAPAYAQTTFSDVQAGYWARPFITELANRGVIRGFPDGSFRPDAPVTRAQFAAMLRQAFERDDIRSSANFVDVPANYWASTAIQEAYRTGFLSGYPGNVFNPEQNIPRVQVLVALANGLNYNVTGTPATALQAFNDAGAIPGYAVNSVAAATQQQIVVNYPNVRTLNPNQTATRAEVAAFIYQALVQSGQATAIASPYIVGQAQTPPPTQAVNIPAGTTIPIRYDDAERILISPEEPQPVPVTLTVSRDIVAQGGRVLIPANSQVVGEIRVEEGGARFYAQQLVLTNGTRINVSATSELLTERTTIRRGSNVGNVLQGAVLGAAAAAGVAAVTGDRAIATEEVLGGVGIGGLLGLFFGRDRVDLLVIDPDTDLNLTLNSALTIQ